MTNKQIIILETVKSLLSDSNTSTTSADVTNFLGKHFNHENWTEKEVSTIMNDFYNKESIPNLHCTSKGTYSITPPRTAKAKTTNKVKSISRSRAIDLIRNSQGRFFTVTFVKKDGNKRVLNGQVRKDSFTDNFGYIKVTEFNGNKRRVDSRTIQKITLNSQTYKVRK